MRYLNVLIISTFAFFYPLRAHSSLLEGVKRNPEEAQSLCKQFRELNEKGISASSEQAIAEISIQKNLSMIEAEILSMYVIGLNCPDVQ